MIDFQALNEYFDHDEDTIQIIFMTYAEEYIDAPHKLTTLYQTKNWEQLFHLVHTLKGTLASFCERDAVPLLDSIERKTKNNTSPNVSEITELIHCLEMVNQQIKETLTVKNT